MLMNYLFKLFTISTLIFKTNGQQVYIQCLNAITQKNGLCKFLHECPAVQEDIKQQRQYTKCNFAGDVLWVCCPDTSDRIAQNVPVISPNPNGANQFFSTSSPNLGGTTQTFQVQTFQNQNLQNQNFQNQNYQNQNFQNQNVQNQNVQNQNLQSIPINTNKINQNTPVTSFRKLHQRKCHEYEQYTNSYVYSIGLAIGEEPKKTKVDECGHKSVPLIVGGEDAGLDEFPHMALIGYERQFIPNEILCAGSLISERFVLTAAHCLNTQINGVPSFVRLGELDVAKANRNAQQIPVEQIIYHPLYNPQQKYHDIGLLKLSQDAFLNSHVIPACLPPDFEAQEIKYIATGWGTLEYDRSASATHLQKVTLDKFSIQECNNFYMQTPNPKLPNGIRSDAQMCAGSRTQSKDTCQGDSGGPLQYYHPNEHCMYIVNGITSFGRKCGTVNAPGVYARVANYIDWIERIVWPGES